ncbi:MAG: riboflavin synthase [Lautropia sp.]|nr:riboflavin synthase [Lautropia sp.]
MFTGIVAAVGAITHLESLGPDAGLRVHVDAPALGLSDVAPGDSIAVQGACMTVVAVEGGGFDFDVSGETLARTVGLDGRGPVNLEKAMRLTDRVGGHLVSGHIDGVGTVTRFQPVAESWTLDVKAPLSFARYLVFKGSVTLNGVSLTINRVTDVPEGCVLSVNLIPHTLAVTTLKALVPGAGVNLEVDMIARYLDRMRAVDTAASQVEQKPGLLST